MIKSLLTSKFTYIYALLIVLTGAIFLLAVDLFIMPGYTNYNEGVTVPDVTRLPLQDAGELLQESGLRFEVADRRSNTAYPADYVIDQTPSPTKIVKPNRKIYLTVNSAVKPKVEVPDLVNLSLRNAQIQLQNYGLEVGTVSYESSRFKNTILRQSLDPGTQVEKGTVVDLAVSDGLGDKIVKIPEIIGFSLSDVQLKLREVGLRVGEIRFRPSREVKPNVVLDYEPKAEEIIEGESLTLVVSERFDAVEESESGAVIIDSTRTAPPDSTQNQN
jgi:beta-lactam-binding protein with PASTA domain